MRYRLLGPVELSGSDGPVRLGGPKRRAVLAALLLNANRVVSEEELLSSVWGEELPATVRGQLQMYVSQLRKLIGEPVIVRRAPGYLIEVRPGELDLDVFEEAVDRARADRQAGRPGAAAERLHDALALWRGPALGGAAGPLLAEEGPELEERRLNILEEYFDARLATGQHAEILDELRHVAADHPFRERLQAQSMSALHQCGRTAEALEIYPRIRARLVEEQGVEPGKLLRDMQARLLRDQEAVLGADQPPAMLVPRQLPADVGRFAGRVSELARLDESVSADGAPAKGTVLVTGGAGVGKTTLAVHWAHQIRERFPDGQLYMNLRGFHPGGRAVPPEEAVLGFLEALSISPQQVPATAEARFGLYRSLLADKRMLIVLDNARNADQVRPLLPGTKGCLAVVTSRNPMPGLVADGACPLPLGLLSEGEAREMLDGRIDPVRLAAEPAAVEKIVTLCARLPLALAIAAARAAANPTFPLSVLADELTQAQDQLDGFDMGDPVTDVRSVFSWSYRVLRPEAAKMFRLLGLHPGPHVTIAAAASLLGVPPREARPLLAELVRAQLITEHRPGQYGFHDLLRAYAAELARHEDAVPDRVAAAHRMFDHYLHTAHHGRLAIRDHWRGIVLPEPVPGVTVPPAGRAEVSSWFFSEYPVLVEIIKLASVTGFDRHVWQLAHTIASAQWYSDARWLGGLDLQYRALEAAERTGDTEGRALAYRGLAVVLFSQRKPAESYKALLRAEELFAQLGKVWYQADAHSGMNTTCDRQGRFVEALRHAERALELFHEIGDTRGEAISLNDIGWSYVRQGKYDLAINYCRRAITILEGEGDDVRLGTTLDSLGYAYHNLGQYREAIVWYEQAIERYRRVRSLSYESRTLNRLGDSHLACGEKDDAARVWRLALDLLEELRQPDTDGIGDKLAHLGRSEW
ncbi:tetratricopeptide repeat protein [Amycolatopsis rhizosphaerae]|uniref:Tetratricopeptide repeat protein n=1 Tax=Amycolatopsis rhizosphaerae TaxID=2053003 RepID=A0A558DKQ6_9PSEU|nr:BTAD domain-containing putative transcriptional regulator [Amycolatopsis rhizosphaerae]TVT61599.1 tetratricopeptide repeat protein [Amycolatopsis rhizosphaerae]